jgi:tetratricopeptide (TPR) repeat protein
MPANPALDEANQLIAAGRSVEARALLEGYSADPTCAVRLRELHLGEQRREEAMAVSRQLAAGHSAEAHVSRSVIALLQGDPERALMECTLALEADPKLATAHNHLGRALHNAGQSLQAVSSLRKAVELHDDYAEAWANLGLVLRATGALDEAIKAYRRAVELAPGLLAAEVNLGVSLLLAEQVDPALFCLESVLKRDPRNIEALLNAGLARHLRGELTKARQYFEHAIQLDEHNPLAWLYLGALLHEIDAREQALEALEKALALNPMEIEAWVEVASIHEQAGRLDEAAAALERARQVDPAHPAMMLELARLKRRQGQLEEALALLEKLGRHRLPARLAQQHCFEAGIALDRAGQYQQAFEAYRQGNQLLARNIRRRDVDPQGFERECRRLEKWLERGAPGARPEEHDPRDDTGADLCFLVGFQRSGTTLLEKMLDAHPDVASLEERPTLERVIDALRASKQGYPEVLETLDGDQVARLRAVYRAELERYLDESKGRVVVDKLPLRFMHAGLVHRLFPDARILLALRHPADVVLSNFMQAFAVNEASIHFDTLQGCTAMYVRAMSLWRRLEDLLPLRLQYTRYEALVADPAAEIAALCSFLGIEPVDAMLDHAARQAGRAPVRTASYQQVAEPLHQRSVGRWMNYHAYLAPHLAQLRPLAEHYGYSLDAQPGGMLQE